MFCRVHGDILGVARSKSYNAATLALLKVRVLDSIAAACIVDT